jgi:ubiquinone/menaquinone biosynthesis C-methylase UbiE
MPATASASINYWPNSRCASAFWGQHELPPYRRLLADTVSWLDPNPGERWLDLGCGGGQLSQALWEKSGGTLRELVGLDCAAANEKAYRKLCSTVRPTPEPGRIRFVACDFSAGLSSWEDGQYNGVVSGLAIQYAEFFCPKQNCWTTAAYDRLLAEVYRVLRKGGRFVFSVNVPEPAWGKVALCSLTGVLRASRPARYLKQALRMWSYGGWLKREARRGRFHYLPLEAILSKLTAAGFSNLEHRLSYAGQAYLLRCRKRA